MALENNKLELKKSKLSNLINIRAYAIVIALIVIWILFGFMTDGVFTSARNLSNLFRAMATVTVLATGMFFVILCGDIDLSVGSLMGMLCGFASIALAQMHLSTGIVVPIIIIIGAIIGTLHGLIVSYVKVPAFIVTLGGYMVYRGILIGVTEGKSISFVNDSFSFIGQAYIPKIIGIILGVAVFLFIVINTVSKRMERKKYELSVSSFTVTVFKLVGVGLLIGVFVYLMNSYEGLPLPVMIMLLLLVLMTFVAEKTKYGRSLYAIGGNAEAARYSGINVRRNRLFVFTISGTMSGIAGIILASRLNAGTPSAGMMGELDAIAAAVIGGASLSGGIGKVSGVIIGALIMASIDNGMSLMNMESFWQYIIKGIILVIAVMMDGLTNKK